MGVSLFKHHDKSWQILSMSTVIVRMAASKLSLATGEAAEAWWYWWSASMKLFQQQHLVLFCISATPPFVDDDNLVLQIYFCCWNFYQQERLSYAFLLKVFGGFQLVTKKRLKSLYPHVNTWTLLQEIGSFSLREKGSEGELFPRLEGWVDTVFVT